MRDEFKNSELWSKRFLPHYDASLKYQMITYRLADSLPAKVLKDLQAQDSSTPGAPQPPAEQKSHKIQKRIILEDAMDKGYGSCLLANSEVAALVVENWQYYHGKKYDLISYVVMPNHVHVLIKTYESWSVGKIVWAWKSLVTKFVHSDPILKKRFNHYLHKFQSENTLKASSSMKAYMKLGNNESSFSIWQREYWDRFIRDEKHFSQAVEYIHNNPVKAGLVKNAEDWKWSSAGS